MSADRPVGIADRDRNLNGRIKYHATPVRRRLMRVASHVKLLRRAADKDRDRLERALAWSILAAASVAAAGRLARRRSAMPAFVASLAEANTVYAPRSGHQRSSYLSSHCPARWRHSPLRRHRPTTALTQLGRHRTEMQERQQMAHA
jgi:hypothetical protein